ncbi:MAG TPA: antibiotic biosynthesis monooxygenase [Actinophytocola sp.]|nr:antibiotic biosynthesis monooxygenase [Actinophytocola sp.]
MAATTSIATGAPIATLINVFVVQPDRQRRLVELLVRATEDVISHQPGFIAANIHASEDGTRVVNYAQWESPAAEPPPRNSKSGLRSEGPGRWSRACGGLASRSPEVRLGRTRAASPLLVAVFLVEGGQVLEHAPVVRG